MMRIYTDYIEPAMKSAEAMGISIGKAEGIIGTARDFGASDNEIVSRLMSKLHIPASEAQQMLMNYR